MELENKKTLALIFLIVLLVLFTSEKSLPRIPPVLRGCHYSGVSRLRVMLAASVRECDCGHLNSYA